MPNLSNIPLVFHNTGDAKAYPVITVKGPATAVEAIAPSGRSWKWVGTNGPDDVLVVDHQAATVEQNGTNVYDGMDPAPRFWWIPPGDSTGTLKITGSFAGGLLASGTVWRNLVHDPKGSVNSGSLAEVRRNKHPNPALRTGSSQAWEIRDWAGGNGTSSVSATSGRTAGYIRKTWTSNADENEDDCGIASSRIGVHPGPEEYDFWTVSAYVRSSIAMTQHYIEVSCYNGDGDKIKVLGRVVTSNIPANTWTRQSTTVKVPDATRMIRVVLSVKDGSQFNTGNTYDACDMLIERGTTLGAWFDGSSPQTSPFAGSWVSGTSGESIVKSPIPKGWSTVSSSSSNTCWVAKWLDELGAACFRVFIPAGSEASTRYLKFTFPQFLAKTEFTTGQKVTYVFQARASTGYTLPVRIMEPVSGDGKLHTVPAGIPLSTDWQTVRVQATCERTADDDAVLYVSLPTGDVDVDRYWDFKAVAVIPGDFQNDYFDGDTPDAGGVVNSWLGTANDSISTQTGMEVSGRTEATVEWHPRRWLVI